MDFTDAYRISASTPTHRKFSYSPGSTYFSTLHQLDDGGGSSSTVVQVRVSTSLQVIQSWKLDFQATSSSWSRDGTLVLIVGRQEFIVLAVDPNARRRRTGARGSDCVVARVNVGMERLASACWIGSGSGEAVCAFSSDELLATIYDIQRGSSLVVGNPKRAKAFSNASKQYLAMLVRQSGKEALTILASPDAHLRSDWKAVVRFALHTNDAVEASWSPTERYLAVREGVLEYKVQIYSPLGYLQSCFQIDSDGGQAASSFTSFCNASAIHESAKYAGGGLGIREMRWSPDGRLLALGGYDEMVRILENSEWSLAATLDLSRKVITPHSVNSQMGTLAAWREPFDWKSETGGRGIVEHEAADMPFTLPSLRIDMGSAATAKSGICWMEWDHDGSLLAVRNDNHPAAVYVYAFPRPECTNEDERIHPYLLSVVMLASSVTLAAWKPMVAEGNGRMTSALAILTSEGQGIHLWSYRGGGGQAPTQRSEAIPIPLDDFIANDFAFAPDGNKILITSQNGTYCCAIEAQDSSIDLQESHL